MQIFPAIDLLDGKVVRLLHGNYSDVTVYSENPREIVSKFKNVGAKNIHIVDLNGARDGNNHNFDTIKTLVSDVFVEVGGGIRTREHIEKYINLGVGRVILGTSALDFDFVSKMLDIYGDSIAVGVDIADGFVSIKGWRERTQTDAIVFCENLDKIGVKTIICTDISRDGAMKGANFELYKLLQNRLNCNIIASGGVATNSDIYELKRINIHGVIIGRAIYEETIDLGEVIKKC